MPRPSQANPAPSPALKRCAIYTRKSTTIGLEQDFNSLDAQREACSLYIQTQASLGWRLVEPSYDDGGFTGANLDRPAFARLMHDVANKKVDIVVVYKVDRLSRSLLDFARVMDQLHRAGAAFVSVTQNFSTADAVGRLTLNMLMSFAQFEREMIADRTRDKIAAARRKGKWTGGPAPLGFDLVDHKLVVSPVEASLVRHIFDLYVEHRSACRVAEQLNLEGRTTKSHALGSAKRRGGKPWDKCSVLYVLRSPVVAGLIPHHANVHEGEHEAIVDRDAFYRVQRLLDDAQNSRVSHGRNPAYLLAGLLRCPCGQLFTPASTRKKEREYRYYRCSTRDKRGTNACPSPPLPAHAIEAFVVQHIRDALGSGTLAADVAQQVQARIARERLVLRAERSRLPQDIASLASEGKRLVAAACKVAPSARRIFDDKLEELGHELSCLEARLHDAQRRLALLDEEEVESDWITRCLAQFDEIWDVLTPENRARLVRTLITRIEVDETQSHIRVLFADLGAPPAPPPSAAGAPCGPPPLPGDPSGLMSSPLLPMRPPTGLWLLPCTAYAAQPRRSPRSRLPSSRRFESPHASPSCSPWPTKSSMRLTTALSQTVRRQPGASE